MSFTFFGFFIVIFVGAFTCEIAKPRRLEDNLKIDLQKKEKYFEQNKEFKNFRNARGNNIIEGKKNHNELDWWQKCFIYQVYPRSFKDSNGDGVEDLKGIIEKIPYLKYIGVGAIWINPIYPSDGIDLGYDITDYNQIDKLFGSIDDFDEFVKKLHDNGIKIILDFVPNHTSEKHEWFIKSVQKIEPYKDYYVWADAKYVNGSRIPPNNWKPIFASRDSMWEWNEQRQQYYLHQFHYQMPDLNYWNTFVHEEMKSVLRFWLDKSVDGFRVDATGTLYEKKDLMDASLMANSNQLQKNGYTYCLNETYDKVVSWRSLLEEYKQKDNTTKLMIVESYATSKYFMKYYGNSTHPGAHFPLYHGLISAAHKPAKFYVDLLTNFTSELPSTAWPNWVIGNHDIIRAASGFGNELIDGMNMIILLLPGTPVVYMADELGMTKTYLRDDQIVNEPKLVSGIKNFRDESRMPFQWTSSAQAGFSNKTKTWLPVNPNYVILNAKIQQNAKFSHLKIFKELVNLRQLEVFQSGDVKFYEVSEYVFVFTRSNNIFNKIFVVVNLGSEMENINISNITLFSKLKVRISSLFAEQNTGDILNSKSFSMRPNAALVLESTFFN